MKINLSILPIDLQSTGNSTEMLTAESDRFLNEYFSGNEVYGFLNGKTAIHFLAEKYNLKRHDEVLISTTSDTNYVASCVTSTLFNYAKVSRVISAATKMIYVIHEFGFVNKSIFDLVIEGKARGIPVVEDVAHSFSSFYKEQRLGTIADYGIYSLPKSFPVKDGGILTGKKISTDFNSNFSKDINERIKKKLPDLLQKENIYSTKRKEIYKFLSQAFNQFKPVYDLDDGSNPFVFGFIHDSYRDVYSSINNDGSNIELFPAYVPGWILIPANPMVSEQTYEEVVKKINRILNR